MIIFVEKKNFNITKQMIEHVESLPYFRKLLEKNPLNRKETKVLIIIKMSTANTGTPQEPRAEYTSLIETADACRTKSFNSSKKERRKVIMWQTRTKVDSLWALVTFIDSLVRSRWYTPTFSLSFPLLRIRSYSDTQSSVILSSLSLSLSLLRLIRSYTVVQKYLHEHLPFLWNLRVYCYCIMCNICGRT